MADRSVPARTSDSSPRDCNTCNGAGGFIVTIRSGENRTSETWQRCDACRGTGTQGGGI